MSAPETRRVLKETLDYVAYHRLGPGDRLPSERELAERFHVGRGPVREALAVLETVRVLERRAQAGFFLRDITRDLSLDAMVLFSDFGIPISESDVRNAVEMRRILELQAVGLACDRRTLADLDRLQLVLEASEAKIAAGQSIAEQDADFHVGIVLATQNDVFVRVVNSFYLLSRSRREAYFQNPKQCQKSHAQHLSLFRTIQQQDCNGALAQLQAHLQGVESYWLATLIEGVKR